MMKYIGSRIIRNFGNEHPKLARIYSVEIYNDAKSFLDFHGFTLIETMLDEEGYMLIVI